MVAMTARREARWRVVGEAIGRIAARLAVLWAVLAGLGAPVGAAVTYDPALQWSTLQGKHFRVHFHDGEKLLAARALAIAERTHQRLSTFFSWEPMGPTDLVLADKSDLPNGFATTFPSNRMVMYVSPPSGVSALTDHDGWLELLITHEYVHVLHLDKASGLPRYLRNVLGRHLLLFPNALQPAWLTEGIATYFETDVAHGTGRGQNAYFDMVMREEVINGIKPLRQINQRVDTWPAGTVPYLYGVHFYSFLVERYGVKTVESWIREYSDNLIPFLLSTTSEQVTGKSLGQLWVEFEGYLSERYEPQVKAIAAAGVREGKPLTSHGYHSGNPVPDQRGGIYYLRDDGLRRAALMYLPVTGQPREVVELESGARFDWHPAGGLIVAQPEVCRNVAVYYDLFRVHPDSGEMNRLTRCGRFRHVAWHSDGDRLIAVSNKLGASSLVEVSPDGAERQVLWNGDGEETVGELDIAPDGSYLVASVWRPRLGWGLERFDLAQHRWTRLTGDRAVLGQPRLTPDGGSVLFSADTGGVFNIYRLDLASSQVDALTNVMGGAFHPASTPDGALVYMGYGARGFDVYRLEGPRPVAVLESLRSAAEPVDPPGEEAEVVEVPSADPVPVSAYSPWRSLAPRWWFPHVLLEAEREEWGVLTSGWDALERHSYAALVAYDVEQDLLVGSLDYAYDGWYPVLKLHASRQNDFLRLSGGELAAVRHSDVYQAELAFPWWSMDERWALHTTLIRDQESDHWRAPGVLALGTRKDNLFGVGVSYDSTRRFPLAVSRQEGRWVRAVAEDSDLLGSDYEGQVLTVDWREYLPVGRSHVIALRGIAGWGTDRPRPFKLGGVLSQGEQPLLLGSTYKVVFNRRSYGLRGYDEGLPALTGRRMALASAEWRFPLRRVERGLMSPPVGIQRLFGTLFVEAGAVWADAGPDDFYPGIGAELNASISLGYQFPLQVRFGVAQGLDPLGETQAYLELGHSF